MDRDFCINEDVLDNLINQKKGDDVYENISKIMEEAFIEGLEIQEEEQEKYRGHGMPNIKHMEKPKVAMGMTDKQRYA